MTCTKQLISLRQTQRENRESASESVVIFFRNLRHKRETGQKPSEKPYVVNMVILVNSEEYYLAMKDYWAFTLVEAVETLTKVFHDPEEASRNMNRLKRHADFQLQQTFKLAEDTVYQTATAGGSR